MISKIVTGEKIQQLCDIYLGFENDFKSNPVIKNQTEKHFQLQNINSNFYNPKNIFCYSHRIKELSEKIHFFQNIFCLFTHNSDEEIRQNIFSIKILNHPFLESWYSQNICFEHNKLHLLPIGFANSQWPHGNLEMFNDINFVQSISNKTKKVYFNFNIETNRSKREICYEILKNKIDWLPNIPPKENLTRLKEYEFCICPEGNGVDTHRLWEALYLKIVPIVIKSEFSNILQKYKIPLVILENWNDFDESMLNYNDYDFSNHSFLNLIDFQQFEKNIT